MLAYLIIGAIGFLVLRYIDTYGIRNRRMGDSADIGNHHSEASDNRHQETAEGFSAMKDFVHGYVIGIVVGMLFILYWWLSHR